MRATATHPELLTDFIDESRQSVVEIEVLLHSYCCHPQDAEALRAVLRSLHTMKGNAGVWSLSTLEDFVHELESEIALIHSHRLAIGSDLLQELIASLGVVDELLELSVTREVPASLSAEHETLLQSISAQVEAASGCQPARRSAARQSSVNQFAEATFSFGEKELTPIVRNVLRAFVAAERNAYSPQDGELSLRSLRQLAALLEQNGDKQRAKSIATAADELSTLLTSELEIDALLLSIVWDSLHTLMDRFRVKPKQPPQINERRRHVAGHATISAASLFGHFAQYATRLASDLGKRLQVHLEGEDVDIDRSLADELQGPLLQLIRNACDHGIETPSERAARGVPSSGSLWLACEMNASQLVITVRDDGRGIDPHHIRHCAVEQGLISAAKAQSLSDQDSLDLIFQHGFSTAPCASTISGRGLGLDVAGTQARKLGGVVSVASVVGEGTTFRLQVPLRRNG